MGRVLSEQEIDQFIEGGWVKVPEAYRPEDALRVQRVVWQHVEERGVKASDPATWTQERVHLRESYRGPEFDRCNTERLTQAIEDLVGVGRLLEREHPSWGWWPVNFFVGRDRPWTIPTRGWHWDGHHFRHFVDSPDQGLLALCVFSEIRSRGGGTLVAEGSHKVIARLLAGHPDGIDLLEAIEELNRTHPWFHRLTNENGDPDSEAWARERIQQFTRPTRDAEGTALRVVEMVANPGDVILCHPFLYHAASQNHSGVPRFLCNRIGTLASRMRIFEPEATVSGLSPVERSIRRALA